MIRPVWQSTRMTAATLFWSSDRAKFRSYRMQSKTVCCFYSLCSAIRLLLYVACSISRLFRFDSEFAIQMTDYILLAYYSCLCNNPEQSAIRAKHNRKQSYTVTLASRTRAGLRTACLAKSIRIRSDRTQRIRLLSCTTASSPTTKT